MLPATSYKLPAKTGVSLVEVILAVALFALFATALLGLLFASYGSNFQALEKHKAGLYAQEGLEAVLSIRRQAWNLLVNGDHGLTSLAGFWQFNGSSDLIENKYQRTITLNDVCRDPSGLIVDCLSPGALPDLHSKQAVVKVSYAAITGVNNEVTLESLLTTWQSRDWLQTNWTGGAGQTSWSEANRYYSDDGQIDYSTAGEVKLVSLGGNSCGKKIWPFTTPTDYTYGSAKIEVSGGLAELKGQAGGTSGATTNPGFDSSTTGWTYADWNQGGGEVNVTGSRLTSGGNPNAWVYVNFPRGSNDELGGYWRQAFTTTVSSPTVNVNFDWQVSQYDPTPSTLQLYVFVDPSPGVPTLGQQVWSSGEITSTSGWVNVSNIDASSRVSSSGTYYLKIAAWVETPGSTTGSFRIGYDNVSLDWVGGTSYPSDNPTINPVASYEVSNIDAWSSFAETAQKNGGEIYYQLSSDNGTTWQYFDGANWTTAGFGQYNPASVVNANLSTFATTTCSIMFKAFLASDGQQAVKLDEVTISCRQEYEWPFTTPTDYTYDSAKIEVSGGLAELKGQAGGTSGATTNPGFDSSTTGWTYADWNQGGGEVNVTGSRLTSGGNPNAWVYVNFPRGSNDELGGYWRQAFTTTVSSPTVNVNFDWQVSQYDPTPSTLQLYVFVDPSPGVPTLGQQVWSSGEITSTSGWVNVSNIDASSRVSSSGTYYLKIAAWVETPGSTTGSFRIGYDNVSLDWVGGTSYPSDNPTINPVASYEVSNIDAWSSFAETAQKNGGEIYYQLSSDNGTTWQYFDGANWTTAGFGQYNPASVVNANLSTFATTTCSIMFKAFLASDGQQAVKLDEVTISCRQEYEWPFTTPTDYTYDSAKIEVSGGLAELKGQAGGTSGATTNPGFDSSTTGWTYADWNQGGGEVNVTGSRLTSGGNPNAWVY